MKKSILAIGASLTLLATSCQSCPSGCETTEICHQAQAEAEGWVYLFDGTQESFETNWRKYKKDITPTHGWTIEDGVLHVARGSRAGDIITRENYANFELELEFKFGEDNVNSGIFYRAPLDCKNIYHKAFEYQLLHPIWGDTEPEKNYNLGGLYSLYGVQERPVNVDGWNQVRIVCDGPYIEHHLNGQLLFIANIDSLDYAERMAKSKFGTDPAFEGYGESETGGIGIQDHGDSNFYFRNIRVRELSNDE